MPSARGNKREPKQRYPTLSLAIWRRCRPSSGSGFLSALLTDQPSGLVNTSAFKADLLGMATRAVHGGSLLGCGTLSSSSPAVAGRKTIVACPRRVYELEEQVITDALHMPVLPSFEWIRGLRPCFGVPFELIRWAVENVHVAAIGLPARPAGWPSKMLVGVRDPAVMFLFDFVCRGGSCLTPQPELLDELVPLLIGGQFFKRGALFIVDDVDHVLVQPVNIRRPPRALRLLLRGTRTLSRRSLPPGQRHRGDCHED